jgi:hypothetical protein
MMMRIILQPRKARQNPLAKRMIFFHLTYKKTKRSGDIGNLSILLSSKVTRIEMA